MNFNYLFILTILILLQSCNMPNESNKNVDKTKNGHIYVDKERLSFGKIYKKEKKTVYCSFILKNTGNYPVTINSIDVSCNCITPEIKNKTIMPKEKEVINVQINAKNQKGHLNKVLFVNSDADNPLILLRVQGDIE